LIPQKDKIDPPGAASASVVSDLFRYDRLVSRPVYRDICRQGAVVAPGNFKTLRMRAGGRKRVLKHSLNRPHLVQT
jgi:hypothetical protein